MKWISVADQLPKIGRDVLIFVTDDMEGNKNFVNIDSRSGRPESDTHWSDGSISHWMPLPPPPIEQIN